MHSAPAQRTSGPNRRWQAYTFAMVACALALAACGSEHRPNSPRASSYARGVKYSDCMRSHGVSNFPDPAAGGGFDIRALGNEALSPAFVSAQKACANLLPGGVPPRITDAQLHQMAAKANCIRHHGFPSFPDPTLGSGGRGVQYTLPANWNIQAPAVVAARKACAQVGIPIPGAGVAWFGTT